MNRSALFCQLSDGELKELSACLCAEEKSFKKNDIITKYQKNDKKAGIVRSGLAYLISINDNGETSILDYYESGNIFGQNFSPNTGINLYYIFAKQNTEVTFYSYDKLISCCDNNCRKHKQYINNLISCYVSRTQIHIDILTQRSIRAKLMTYFRYISRQNNNTAFSLPLSLSDLADYIAADRSAMMREIKKMNNENIITSKGSTITLL